MNSETYWTYCELDISQNYINNLASINPDFNWKTKVFPGINQIQCCQLILYPADSGNSDGFLPLSVQSPLQRNSGPLGKNWTKANCKTFRFFIRIFPHGNMVNYFIQGFWLCKMAQAWKLIHWLRLLFVTTQCSLSFFEIFLLIRIKQKCSRFLICFMPENAMID